MNLKILLPDRIFAEKSNVLRIVAESGQGAFGLLPQRLDCVMALVPGILVYETAADGEVCLAVDQGVLVTGVLKDGPASRGRVKPGDVVLRVGAAPIANTTQLLAAVAALVPQSEVTLTVHRAGQTLALKVQVGQRPPPAQPG